MTKPISSALFFLISYAPLQVSIGGGGGNIGKNNKHGGGDGGDDGGDDDDYFGDFEEGDEGDEGGLFRRRTILEEVRISVFINIIVTIYN